MSAITLAQTAKIIEGALAHAETMRLKPLTVAVLDPGGHLTAFVRQDNSGILRPEIAQAKAWGALGMGAGGRALAERAAHAPGFYAALATISQGRMAPVPGGVLIEGLDGTLMGAVGISGDLPDNDEACAIHGIELAGLKAVPAERQS